jgi:hypothetical protein
VDVAAGPMKDFSMVMHMESDLLKRSKESGFVCGMLEYRVR